MRVCLRRGYHSVYNELVNNPPKNVQYYIPKYITPSKSKLVSYIKRTVWRSYLTLANKPHAVSIDPKDCVLIHSGAGIIVKNNFPWVIDLEHAASFVGFKFGRLHKVRSQVEKYLSSLFCRKIMPWSNAGKKSLLNGLDCRKFLGKIQVVYPAVKSVNTKKRKNEKVELLFVSNRFYAKGGKEVLEAYDYLVKKFDVHLTIISDIGSRYKKKFPDVDFVEPNVPREKLYSQFFSKTDIFVLPSYMDSFGMVFLEAMSHSIPVVATNTFAIPELVGKAGFLIDASKYSYYGRNYLFALSWEKFLERCEKTDKPEIVDQIIQKTASLIDSSSLRRKMGEEGKKQIEKGKFSIRYRNESLRKVYNEAVG